MGSRGFLCVECFVGGRCVLVRVVCVGECVKSDFTEPEFYEQN